jgi:bacteriocin-like protein
MDKQKRTKQAKPVGDSQPSKLSKKASRALNEDELKKVSGGFSMSSGGDRPTEG